MKRLLQFSVCLAPAYFLLMRLTRIAHHRPPGMKRGERDHLLPSEPDKAETHGYDARAVVGHCSIVRPCEQSCSLCEAEKPNSNKQRANDPKDDLHDSTLAARSTTAILIETKRVAIEKAAERARRLARQR